MKTDVRRLRILKEPYGYLFGPVKAKKWWATKKLLVKDPRVAVPNKKSEPYVLRDEPVKPEREVLQDFFDEKDQGENRLGGKL